MGLTVLLPVMDSHDITDEAIWHLFRNAFDPDNLDIMVVDNASTEPYRIDEIHHIFDKTGVIMGSHKVDGNDVTVIRNEINVAGYGALLQTLELADYDIILWMHNDVLIHEQSYDTRILREFKKDPLLGIAGFFGAYGVADNGGRIGSMGNMLGKVWGTPQHMHGEVLTGTYPATVFDSLAIIINRTLFKQLNVDHSRIPPHHWNDRILPLLFVLQGYHALTIGIEFDHKGGVSSLGDKYRELAERWSREHNIPFERDWDYTFYHAGETYFRELGKGHFPVIVNKDFSIRK